MKKSLSILLSIVAVTIVLCIPALAADEAPDAPVPVEAAPEIPMAAADKPATIAAATPNGWVSEGGSWYYYKNGERVYNDWLQDGGVWYFLDPDGKMLEGLTQIDLGRGDDGWYYFSEKHDGTYGHVMTGWQWIDGGWSTDENGWDVWVSGAWYYFNPQHNGKFGRAYDNGWNKIGGEYYYFYDNGKMAASTVVDGYHVDGNGVRGEKETVREPWFTDEELRRAEDELYEYAEEKYGLKRRERNGAYCHDFYFGLDCLYPAIEGMHLKATTEYDGLVEYGKDVADETFNMWANHKANVGDVGIYWEQDDFNDGHTGEWGYHIYVFYATDTRL